MLELEQADIVSESAEATQQVAIIVIAALVFALKAVQEHFSTDDRRRATERAHCHVASLSLEHSAQATALLPLHGRGGGGGNDSGEAGATSGAVSGADGSHRHTDGAAQYHGLLPHHRLLLVSRLAVLLWIWPLLRIASAWLLVLRLAVWGLPILRLSVLGLSHILRLVILRCIGLRWLPIGAGLRIRLGRGRGRGSPRAERAAAAAAEAHTGGILPPAVVAIRRRASRGGGCRSCGLHGLTAIGAEGGGGRDFRVTGDTLARLGLGLRHL